MEKFLESVILEDVELDTPDPKWRERVANIMDKDDSMDEDNSLDEDEREPWDNCYP